METGLYPFINYIACVELLVDELH
ncbi:uncharacterized protein METZ01_LOCUS245366 [marine metagenome]|uniref:Uncharacterized protein n=1 Tax=marine metagenome TaxID=408172 RepID=A0A382HZK1_9ZZZZ